MRITEVKIKNFRGFYKAHPQQLDISKQRSEEF